jgi:Tfp pilus assembly protein PilO
MTQSSAKAQYMRLIGEQLCHPVKLRFVMCAAIMSAWYFVFFGPLFERVSVATANIARQRKRVTSAREIEQLKEALAPYQGLIPPGTDAHELMGHVNDHLRSSPLKLIDLKPEKPRDLGPYEAIGLQLVLEGPFSEIDKLLEWVGAEQRLLRIDSIKLSPTSKDPGRLQAQLTLLCLAEKHDPATKAKTEAAKKR